MRFVSMWIGVPGDVSGGLVESVIVVFLAQGNPARQDFGALYEGV